MYKTTHTYMKKMKKNNYKYHKRNFSMLSFLSFLSLFLNIIAIIIIPLFIFYFINIRSDAKIAIARNGIIPIRFSDIDEKFKEKIEPGITSYYGENFEAANVYDCEDLEKNFNFKSISFYIENTGNRLISIDKIGLYSDSKDCGVFHLPEQKILKKSEGFTYSNLIYVSNNIHEKYKDQLDVKILLSLIIHSENGIKKIFNYPIAIMRFNVDDNPNRSSISNLINPIFEIKLQ